MLLTAVVILLPVTLRAQAIRLLPGTPVPRTPAPRDTMPLRPEVECVAIRAAAEADSTLGPRTPVEVAAIVAPEARAPMSMKGNSYRVRFRVNPLGQVDSIEIAGPRLDRGFEKVWTKSLRAHRFRTARYNGCRITGWFELTTTFN